MRYPEVQGMWGASWCVTYTTYQCPLLLIIIHCYLKLYTTALHHYLSLIIATPSLHYYATSLLIINYCHTELCTTNYDNCFDTQRPTTPSGQQSPNTTALPLKTLIHAETRLIFAINHRFTHCPRAYCKKLQHRYIELAKREIYWDKDNVLRIWGRNAITLQLYRKRSKLWGPDN